MVRCQNSEKDQLVKAIEPCGAGRENEQGRYSQATGHGDLLERVYPSIAWAAQAVPRDFLPDLPNARFGVKVAAL